MIPRILMDNQAESLGRTTDDSNIKIKSVYNYFFSHSNVPTLLFWKSRRKLVAMGKPTGPLLPRTISQGNLGFWIPEVCFSRVPRTFRALKASCQSGIHLFWKADVFTFFVRKNKSIAKFDGLGPRLCEDRKRIVAAKNSPEKFPDFRETGSSC